MNGLHVVGLECGTPNPTLQGGCFVLPPPKVRSGHISPACLREKRPASGITAVTGDAPSPPRGNVVSSPLGELRGHLV